VTAPSVGAPGATGAGEATTPPPPPGAGGCGVGVGAGLGVGTEVAAGVTGSLGAEAVLVPTSLTATTVNVEAVPFTRLLTMAVIVVPSAVVTTGTGAVPRVACTW
jgi:hypothetical protein